MQEVTKASFFLLLFLTLHANQTLAFQSRIQFRTWYPEFRSIFNNTLHNHCRREYDTYLYAEKNVSHVDSLTGGEWTNQLAQPVVNCILEHISEFIKTNMASAQVLLGLTPSMLAVLGPSTEETALLCVIGRRPALAMLVAAGSPAVFPMRSFDNRDPLGIIKERQGRLRPPATNPSKARVIFAIEYVVVIAAIANVATLSKALGYQVVCNFAPHLTYLVLLWAYLILIIHGSGAIALSLRAHVSIDKAKRTAYHCLRIQFTPFEEQRPIRTVVVPETYWFTFFSWFTAIFTVCHVIYGTLTFSSMLFISVRDSITVITRYLASVLCCRIVLMYELAMLRDSFNIHISPENRSTVESKPPGLNSLSPRHYETW